MNSLVLAMFVGLGCMAVLLAIAHIGWEIAYRRAWYIKSAVRRRAGRLQCGCCLPCRVSLPWPGACSGR